MLHKPTIQIVLMMMVLLVAGIVSAQATPHEVLVYVLSNGDGTQSVVIHDLVADTRQPIITHPSPQRRSPVAPVISADGHIAYAAYKDDLYEIVVWDDAGLTNLGEGFNPSWSMDGRLAFSSDRDAKREVYVWDGETITRITNFEEETDGTISTYPLSPVWSNDGRLAFQVQAAGGNNWVAMWDGATLIKVSESSYIIGNIAWSADGRLAFKNVSGLQIWEDGTLTTVEVPDVRSLLGDFVWSADGRLAFKIANDAAGNETELYVWDGDTILVLGSIAYAYSAVWSSEGHLAFQSERDGNLDVFVWDSETFTNISQSSALDIYPVWNSEGKIAFTTTGWGVFVWDGETTTQVSDGVMPRWMP